MTNLNEIAQPWQRERATMQTINLPPNNRFFYGHYPTNWEIKYIEKPSGKKTIKTAIWLPVLSTHWISAGVNGGRANGKNVDDSYQTAKLLRLGWTIIDPNRIDYLVSRRTKGGGRFWSCKFTKFTAAGLRILKQFNQNDFDQWRIELVANGYIPMPNLQILAGIYSDESNKIERKINKQHIPEIKIQIEKINTDREAMQTAIDDLDKNGIEVYKCQ